MDQELQKKYQCRWCGKGFISITGKVCPHCGKPQNKDKIPLSEGGDSIADIYGDNK
jgi:rRNA maturation endonuclease Nob1